MSSIVERINNVNIERKSINDTIKEFIKENFDEEWHRDIISIVTDTDIYLFESYENGIKDKDDNDVHYTMNDSVRKFDDNTYIFLTDYEDDEELGIYVYLLTNLTVNGII